MSGVAPSSQNDAVGPCRDSGGLSKLFRNPVGFRGRCIAHLMARKNQGMNELALTTLALTPRDCVLEIGFGPGTALQQMLVPNGPQRVVGLERSAEMLAMAQQRCNKSQVFNRLELRLGTPESMSFGAESFTKIFSVNCFQFWQNQEVGLQRCFQALVPGGLLLLPLRIAMSQPVSYKAPGFSLSEVAQVVTWMKGQGFQVERESKNQGGRVLEMLRGMKPS